MTFFKMADKTTKKLFLGFDFSTQQIKVIAVDETLKIVYEEHVRFGTDLPEFGTTDGVCIHDDQVTVTSPTAMWVKGLDMLLDKMKTDGFDFGSVVALSGDGQQHGSVYWKTGARKILNSLKTEETLYDQLKDVFSIPNSPIWMDASTTKQCRQLEEAVGGPMELSVITGSRGFERFTGTQIMKISQCQREAYENTERISLVSSFAASLFLGDYAPIDLSDGSGMNLLDIQTRKWSSKCLDACGSDLASKLGDPVPSHQIVGNVSSYLVEKYGFSPSCKICAFTGDNPASLAGMASEEGGVIMHTTLPSGGVPEQAGFLVGRRRPFGKILKIAVCLQCFPRVISRGADKISLGTGDGISLWLQSVHPRLAGHVLVNPLHPDAFMGLLCWKNGSLVRQHMMEKNAGSWGKFSEVLRQTPPGNNGNIGIYFDVTEIQPVVRGVFRYNENNEKVDAFPPEVEVRALLEGQFLARLMYAKKCGLKIGPETRVLATGGASANDAILQVIADIFNTPVYTIDVPNSAALGGCYRAKHSVEGGSFSEAVKGLPEPICAAKPTSGLEKMYEDMLSRYQQLEQQVAEEYEVR